MKIRALRGVCIGVNRNLGVGDSDDLDAATVTFLKSIGAVESVPEEDPKEPKEQKSKAQKPTEPAIPASGQPSKKEK